ncbi:MAG: YlbF family regulator [Lachnospiraceae bacterium]|nr:YlbF family regulator [Lachnospiraceae bacterium]
MTEDRYGVRELPEYARYQECEAAMLRVPGLKIEIDKLRVALYELHDHTPAEGFLTANENLWKTYGDLMKIPEAVAFLRAEAGLNRKLREFCGQTVLAADMIYPG